MRPREPRPCKLNPDDTFQECIEQVRLADTDTGSLRWIQAAGYVVGVSQCRAGGLSMSFDEEDAQPMMPVLTKSSGDGVMGREARWDEIQRPFHNERRSISSIVRELGVDRNAVRRGAAFALALGAATNVHQLFP